MYFYELIFIAIECPEGMVYQQCGQVCPQTCDSEEDEDCAGGCVEGCFCPSGKVVWNGNCINSSECAGIYALPMYMYNKRHIRSIFVSK